MKSYIYKIINNINGKYYIGKSVSPKSRWNDHLSIARTGKPKDGSFNVIHAAIKKYNSDNFSFIILSEHISEEDAFIEEKRLIKLAKEVGDEIYNITDGGEGVSGYRHTEESKKLMSEQRKGRKQSLESRQKQSRTMTGRIRSEEHCKSISRVKTGVPNPGAGIKNSIRFQGENARSAKLTEQQSIEVMNLINQGLQLKTIAEKYQLAPCTVSDIKTKRTWKHLSHLLNAK